MSHRLAFALPLVLALVASCANEPPASPSSLERVTSAPISAAFAAPGSTVVAAAADAGGVDVSASCVGPLLEWQLKSADGSAMGGTCCPSFDAAGSLLRADSCDIFTTSGRFAGARSFQSIGADGEVETFRFLVSDSSVISIVAQYDIGEREFTARGRTTIRKERVTGRCKLFGADDTSGRGYRWALAPTSLTQMGEVEGWLAFCPPS